MSREPSRDSGMHLAQAARDYIEAHSGEKFSLQAISDALFVNGSHLLRVFRAQTGMTLLGYHNLVRCEQAKRLLVEPEMSISRIGEAVGFVSSAHFTHVFKKTVGMTPTEYRAAHMKCDAEL